MESTSDVVRSHVPCGDCGSSDGMCEYSDGHTYCFVCEAHHQGGHKAISSNKNKELIPYESLTLDAIKARGLTKDTCAKYGYYKDIENGIQVACYYNDKSEIIGQKIRTKNKDFAINGKISNRFFGQHLFPGGGKKLIITEGEIDCLTVSQVQGNKYPVVSIPCGSNSAKKTFQAQMEWLGTFEEVIVVFDMDEAGRKAVSDVEGILKPGQLKIAYLPLKDPNECLLQGKADEIVKAIWNAKTYKPDGIINGIDLWAEMENEEDDVESIPLPWDIELNKMTMGIRKGELLMLTAGTGIGKSTIAKHLEYDLCVKKGLKIGLMHLEENKKRTAVGMMSLHVGKRLHINRDAISPEEYKKAFDETMGTGRFIIYDHFGSIEGDNLLSKMRYMATGEGCDFIFLDHISIAVSGLEGNDERRIIDRLMTQIRSLIEETGIGMIVISHLRKTDGAGASHEEGAMITLDALRGSGTLKQLPDTIIAGERNQQAEGKEKNLVKLRVLKCRFTGETGIGGYLFYNKDTDRLETVDNLSDYLSESVDLGDGRDHDFIILRRNKMLTKLPIINKGVTMQEIPGEISVFFEFGGCTQKCPGCHSPYNQERINKDLYTSVDDMVNYAKKEKLRGATAILLMGGTTNRIGIEDLGRIVQELGEVLPVGIYSGAEDNSQAHKFLKELPDLYWIKTGPYIQRLGGLNSPTTNQRFYKKVKTYWEDVTSEFQL